MGGRGEAVSGPLGGAPTQGAASGLLRESDDAAAATAAAASAVKFMLIESEAAATSASFLPAQFSLLLFLRSSQPTAPTAHTHAQLSTRQGKNQESVAEIEPKGKGGHTRIL